MIPEIARFESSVRKWTLPVAISISYAINRIFNWAEINTDLGFLKEVFEITAFFCLTILSLFLENFVVNLTKFKQFRRIILRSNFFEGAWLEIIRSENSTGRVIELAITFIVYDAQSRTYVINGYGKRNDTGKLDHYYSVLTQSGPLKLEYCWRWSTHGRTNFSGVSVFTFLTGSRGIPHSYTGEYYDPGEQMICWIEGRRIVNLTRVREVHESATRRHLALIPLVEELFPDQLTDVHEADAGGGRKIE